MEHLLFNGADLPHNVYRSEAGEALHADVLEFKWLEHNDLMDFVDPKTPWEGFPHDELPFSSLATYSKVAGFDEQYLWTGNFRRADTSLQNASREEVGSKVAAFFQSWLFYGLLESVIHKKIRVSYLMRQDCNGQGFLYTRNLHYCMRLMMVQSYRASEDAGEDAIDQKIASDLSRVFEWVVRFTRWDLGAERAILDTAFPGFLDKLKCVLPAIIRLAETIDIHRRNIFEYSGSRGVLPWFNPQNVQDERRYRIRDLGWCPFQIRYLEDTLTQSAIDWITAKGICQNPAGHGTCSEEACSRNNIDESTYEQAHVCPNQNCEKLVPNVPSIMQTLRANKIPIVLLEVANGRTELVDMACSKSEPHEFIALSHVWADGLGGCTEQGVNRCQIERISQLCSALQGTSANCWFWLDSLCIPRSAHDVYIKALVGIRDVYISASSVLVIDKMIERCSLNSADEEIFAHIYMSAWMQRMWTFEEAVLAKDLQFLLRDGFYTIDYSNKPSLPRRIIIVLQNLRAHLATICLDSQHTRLSHIADAFRFRLTNAPQEEFLSISGILGLDTEQLLKVKGDERTKTFWRMLKFVPYSCPFQECPKLSLVGFRWAPKSFMHSSGERLSDVYTSECTENGLVDVYFTLSLNKSLPDISEAARRIFHIQIKRMSDDSRPQQESFEMLRLVWTGSEAEPVKAFNTVIVPATSNVSEAHGTTTRAVVLMSEEKGMQSALVATSKMNSIDKYAYVGFVAVEFIQTYDLDERMRTLTFLGQNSSVVHANGIWERKKICIT